MRLASLPLLALLLAAGCSKSKPAPTSDPDQSGRPSARRVTGGPARVERPAPSPAEKPSPKPAPKPKTTVRQLDYAAAGEIEQAFYGNPLAARKKYADTRWRFSARVDEIAQSTYKGHGAVAVTFSVTSSGPKPQQRSYNVTLVIPVADVERVAKAKRFTFEGTITGYAPTAEPYNDIEFIGVRLVD